MRFIAGAMIRSIETGRRLNGKVGVAKRMLQHTQDHPSSAVGLASGRKGLSTTTLLRKAQSHIDPNTLEKRRRAHRCQRMGPTSRGTATAVRYGMMRGV